ncbi:hypothetical protein LCI18_012805 [Fusarium solani-melongenae]|uniref:Uncharacterized protein n=1 Tax=Fusarium solani subsp. cucurbitae TaxID=2747967 RepID=A0ACD3ZKV7_FUSSC|nr:hypothetical protein LCI18_012805 [Fusarium solani-melongenae]
MVSSPETPPRASSGTSQSETIIATVEFQSEPVSHWQALLDQAGLTSSVFEHIYDDLGTVADPFVVDFLPRDPRNPLEFSRLKKVTITVLQAVAALAVTFVSSAYSAGIADIGSAFDVSREVAILGISLYVLGFAIGPLLWAPLSDLFGRQVIFTATYMIMTIFNAVAAAVSSIESLIVFRFFAGSFGASCLTNASGVMADMFEASERGIATSGFAMAPFMGPVIGPIVGGFLGQAKGWRWLHGLMAIFTGTLWIVITMTVPETYASVLLRRRAEGLSKRTGKIYISRLDLGKAPVTIVGQFKTALSRPLVMLFREPIVLLTSVYMAIIHGILYLCFAAFPIFFQAGRGWAPGVGACPLLALQLVRYSSLVAETQGVGPPPEARLPPAIVGAVAIPIGMFWFAWTTYPSIHWVVPIVGSVFFGAGLVLVFASLINYLVDSYVVYAASVLAANSVIRTLFGAAFPLFTSQMYDKLGNQWATSVPAFVSLICLPCPIVLYLYGQRIRDRCVYASEAAKVLKKMQNRPTEESI